MREKRGNAVVCVREISDRGKKKEELSLPPSNSTFSQATRNLISSFKMSNKYSSNDEKMCDACNAQMTKKKHVCMQVIFDVAYGREKAS